MRQTVHNLKTRVMRKILTPPGEHATSVSESPAHDVDPGRQDEDTGDDLRVYDGNTASEDPTTRRVKDLRRRRRKRNLELSGFKCPSSDANSIQLFVDKNQHAVRWALILCGKNHSVHKLFGWVYHEQGPVFTQPKKTSLCMSLALLVDAF